MTREEAVKIIKKEQEYCDFDSQGYEAFSMAVEALEQEPCEDAISRQAETMNSNDRFDLMNDRDDWQKEIDKAYQRINEIDDELDKEYEDGETCWAANLEAEKEELEEMICDLEKRIEDYDVAISETSN